MVGVGYRVERWISYSGADEAIRTPNLLFTKPPPRCAVGPRVGSAYAGSVLSGAGGFD